MALLVQAYDVRQILRSMSIHVDSCRSVGWVALNLPRYLVLHTLRVTKITPHRLALCYQSSHALKPLARIFLI